MDSGNTKGTFNVGVILHISVSTPKSSDKNLTGQGQASKENQNSSSDAEVASYEGHDCPGVYSVEYSEEKKEGSIHEAPK